MVSELRSVTVNDSDEPATEGVGSPVASVAELQLSRVIVERE